MYATLARAAYWDGSEGKRARVPQPFSLGVDHRLALLVHQRRASHCAGDEDVTERRAAEDARREAETRFTEMVRTSATTPSS